jgi:mercuric ion binding protein
MKTLRLFSLVTIFLSIASIAVAQQKTENIPVSGNCGMCKAKIEKAAKDAGATTANWNVKTKTITIKFNSSTTNAARIQQSIADAGYDTKDFKANDEAYNKLHSCCQYDRSTAKEDKHQCADNCDMKDGKCTDMAACKAQGCCKDEAACKEASCCSKTEANSKMDCCKDGKCSKPGHNGQDCCKKS